MARIPKPKPGQWVKTRTPGVYKRIDSEGREYFQVAVYNPEKGSSRRDYFKADTYDAAKDIKAREDKKRKAARGRSGVETVETWGSRWLKVEPRDKESTNLHNAQQLKAFVRDFGPRPLASITPQEAELWAHGGAAGPELDRLAEKWHGAKRDAGGDLIVPSHTASISVVKVFFSDALRRGLGGLEFNPFANVKKGSASKRDRVRTRSFLSAAEVEELAAIARRAHGPQGRYVIGPMIQIAAYTGLRPGELFGLHPEDVDLEAEELHVRRAWNSKTRAWDTPKSHELRTVALLEEAAEAFRSLDLPECERATPIFKTARGHHITQRNLHYYWDSVRKAFADSRPADHWLTQRMKTHGQRGDLDFYELRHFFGSHLAALGVSPYDIAEQMGHADGGKLAMDTYIKVKSVDSRERVKALARARRVA